MKVQIYTIVLQYKQDINKIYRAISPKRNDTVLQFSTELDC